MIKAQCSSCKFWRPVDKEPPVAIATGDGDCLRFPPAWVMFANDRGAETTCAFPRIGGGFWCGEHVQKVILAS